MSKSMTICFAKYGNLHKRLSIFARPTEAIGITLNRFDLEGKEYM